jgi:hypothetical protein
MSYVGGDPDFQHPLNKGHRIEKKRGCIIVNKSLEAMRSKIKDYKKVSLMIEIYVIIDVREEDRCRRKLKRIISRALEKNPRR